MPNHRQPEDCPYWQSRSHEKRLRALEEIRAEYKEFIKLLNAKGVRYLVVSGYAVAVHRYPRNTKDLDI